MKKPHLSESDWTEIYYALDFKLNHSPAVDGDGDTRWQGHLKSIMSKIGPDGDKAWKRYRIHEQAVYLLSQLINLGEQDIYTDAHEYSDRVNAIRYFIAQAVKLVPMKPVRELNGNGDAQ